MERLTGDTLKSRTLLRLGISTQTASWRKLHDLARICESWGPSRWILQCSASACFGFRTEINLRHSITESENFNMYFSDLDFSAITEREPTADQLQTFLRLLGFIRIAFPFLGECEIYTREENSELKQIECDNLGCYALIRLVRKLQWVRPDQPFARSYDKAKAARARKITLSKIGRTLPLNKLADLGIQLGYWAVRWMPIEPLDLPELPNRIWSDFWGYFFIAEGSVQDAQTLKMSARERLALISLIPDQFHSQPEVLTAASECRRQNPQLMQLWQQNCKIQALTLKAWGRAQSNLPDWYAPWLKQIENWAYP